MTAFSAERIELVIPITDDVKQQDGFVHGGVVGYAADNALTFAGGLAFEGAPVVIYAFVANAANAAVWRNAAARAVGCFLFAYYVFYRVSL